MTHTVLEMTHSNTLTMVHGAKSWVGQSSGCFGPGMKTSFWVEFNFDKTIIKFI